MFINSLDDFYIHTKNHIDNVNLLASELMEMVRKSPMLRKYYNIPENVDFDGVKQVVMNGLKLHDQAKINISKDFLDKYQLSRPLYKDLYSRYGKGRSEKEWAITKPIIDKLNKIDEGIMEDYASQFEPWLASLILGVESISDKVERGQNPITPEEMGQPPLIASEFLKGQINEYEMAMVKVLEERYYEFCDYRINKKVISKEKFWDFIVNNNLTDYVIEDDLSFKIKKDVIKDIIKTDDQVSKDNNYNILLFDIVKNQLEEEIFSIVKENKFAIQQDSTYENYSLSIKNLNNNEYLFLDNLVSFKSKEIFSDLYKENNFMKFLYSKESPIFSQKHYTNCINYNSLLVLKSQVEKIQDLDDKVEEIKDFFNL
jgi:hypothetical protein